MEHKWKFIHNGDGWWLRIENVEELIEYQKFDNRCASAFNNLFKHETRGEKLSNLGLSLRLVAEKNQCNLLDASTKLNMMMYKTYLDNIHESGFVNINCMGGCNSIDWDIKAVEYRDKLSFPNYTIDDIKIKTFKDPSNYTDGYNYHYYAYIGNLQLKDGNKNKWNTHQEAFDFAKTFVS